MYILTPLAADHRLFEQYPRQTTLLYMLFIFDIITVCLMSVFKAVVLEANIVGYHGNSKP